MQKEREIEIDVKSLAKYLHKRWKTIFLITIITAACAFGITKFLVTPIYESQSMIYITATGSGGSVVQNMLSSLQAGNALTADYKTLATSKPVLEQVIQELGLEETYAELKEKVSTENPDNTRILIIKVKDADPRKAKQIVDKLTEVERDKIADVMEQPKPSILQRGDIQTRPVSASAAKTGAAAGILALMLTLCVMLVSFIQNDNITSSEDIESTLGLGTLAEIPVFDESSEKSTRKHTSKRRKRR